MNLGIVLCPFLLGSDALKVPDRRVTLQIKTILLQSAGERGRKKNQTPRSHVDESE